MTIRSCSTSTKSDSTCPSPQSRSVSSSPLLLNALAIDRCKGADAIVLPSLCKQIEEPEAHPDFEAVMASLKQRSPFFIKQKVHPASSIKKLTVPVKRTAENPLHYYSSRNIAIAAKESTRNVRPRLLNGQQNKLSTIDVSAPRPATIYAAAGYKIMVARYATSADPRGFLPVYEYQLHGHTLMIDMETSYVQLATLCDLIGPSGAHILKSIESSAELRPYIRKIEGGFLKIQGAWVTISIARELARRVAWKIRFDLVPFFGYQFPTQCLSPNDAGYGDLRLLTGPRKSKRFAAVERFTSQPALDHHLKSRSERSPAPEPSDISRKLLPSWPEQSSSGRPVKIPTPHAAQAIPLLPSTTTNFTPPLSRSHH